MYEREAYIARLAVQKAAVLTRAVAEKVLANKASNTITKIDKSPVTVGDYSAQAIVINAIKQNFPNDEIIGEEDAKDLKKHAGINEKILKELQQNDVDYFQNYKVDSDLFGPKFTSLEQVDELIDQGSSKGGKAGRFWALDPIDGTKGFLRGEQYAVCLALIVNGVVQLGVIGCPNLPDNFDSPSYKGGLFTAVKGQGSFYSKLYDTLVQEDLKNLLRIHMRNNLASTSDIKVCEGVEKAHSSHDDQLKIKEYLKIPVGQTLNLDSQVKYCALSKGLADLYLRLPIDPSYREKVWDHAAGNVLITESGGIVTDMHGNQLDFSTGRTLKSSGVIAANKQFHSQVIEAIKSTIE